MRAKARRRLVARFALLLLVCVVAVASIMMRACFGTVIGKISIMAYPQIIKTGESIIINGSIIDPIVNDNQNVSIYYKPIGGLVKYHLAKVTTDKTGKYSYNWTGAGMGTYQVSATWIGLVDSTLYVAENSTTVYVKAPPVASFTYTPLTPEVDETVTFNASASHDPDGTIISYGWDFGDGDTATGNVTTHPYTTANNYTVTLTVTDNDTLTDTFTRNVTVSFVPKPPVASFSFSPKTPTTGESVEFDASKSDDPDGTIVSFSWDFGDGSKDNGEIVDYAYADNGTYTVKLTVTDDDDLSDTYSKPITVLNRPPNANFTESAETVPTGESIKFDASNSSDPDGTIASYFWDFGDGTNDTGKIVYHPYADNGTYTVTLTVTDDDGATDSATADKTVLNRPPVAAFTALPETAYINDTINFDASDSDDLDGDITDYFWDFGDGTNGTGETTEHFYSEEGDYVVTLSVTDDDGATNSTSVTKTVVNRPPDAVFTESAEEVYTNESIHFDASESDDLDGEIVSYLWDFGDGSTSTDVVVDHAYMDNGTYTVTLTVTDDKGATSTATATKKVLNRQPVVIFSESAETIFVGKTIDFNASDSYDPDGTILSYSWDFGDSTNATGVIVTHAYETEGTFNVTLTLTDDDGASNSSYSTKTILVNKPPLPLFTTHTVFTGEVITFNAIGSYDPDGNITDFFWDFGDGANATGVVVEHAYTDDGIYRVTLTITDDQGESTSAYAGLTVLNRSPIPLFTDNATLPFTDEIIHFDATGSYDLDGDVVSYFWDFGDDTNATGVTVNHAYEEDRNYTVTLTVTDDDSGAASMSAVLTVLNRPPVALFIDSASTVGMDGFVRFDASSSYDPDGILFNYFWDFGDGTNASMAVILDHAYAKVGDYTVTLTVTDDDGASSSVSATITVTVSSWWSGVLISRALALWSFVLSKPLFSLSLFLLYFFLNLIFLLF